MNQEDYWIGQKDQLAIAVPGGFEEAEVDVEVEDRTVKAMLREEPQEQERKPRKMRPLEDRG